MAKSISQLPLGALTNNNWVETSSLSQNVVISGSTISANASDNSFNDSALGFIAAGFANGDRINIAGAANPANNIFSAIITSCTSGKIIIGGLDGDVISNESAGSSITISKWISSRVNIASAFEEEPASWSNGCGENRFLLSATVSGAFVNNVLSALTMQERASFYWNGNTGPNAAIVFDFFHPVIVNGFAVVQDSSPANGIWTISGSNDNSTWVDLITDFQWGGLPYDLPNSRGVVGNTYAREFTNSTYYRYYRVRLNTGSTTTNAPYILRMMFKCTPLKGP